MYPHSRHKLLVQVYRASFYDTGEKNAFFVRRVQKSALFLTRTIKVGFGEGYSLCS